MANPPADGKPSPPSFIAALRGGFDAVANHVTLLIFPVALDMLLWLGPHVQLKKAILGLLNELGTSPAWEATGSAEIWENNLPVLQEAANRLNLMTNLRSLPVGIPSLMSGLLPVKVPGGAPLFWDVSNPWLILGLVLLLTVFGLGAGSLYFSIVAQAALGGSPEWRKAIQDWPRAMLQVLSLAVALLIALLIISLPSLCIFSVIAWGGLPLGQLGIIIYLAVLLWIAFPVIFTPHGIFAYRIDVLTALRKSVRLTRLTLPTTSFFILIIFMLSEGLDILWRVPAEDSWLMVLGIAGHAFITTGLLAATFLYFRDADRWVQIMLEKARSMQAHAQPPG